MRIERDETRGDQLIKSDTPLLIVRINKRWEPEDGFTDVTN